MLGVLEALASYEALINLGTLAVTCAVAAVGIYQFRRTIQFGRDQSAKSLFADYLKISMDNPKLAGPSLGDIDFDLATFDGSKEEFARYEWFVSYMISVYEEIFHLAKREDAWTRTMEVNLRDHIPYLSSHLFHGRGYLDHVDEPLRSTIASMIANREDAEVQPPLGGHSLHHPTI